jgi:hypothetical protein
MRFFVRGEGCNTPSFYCSHYLVIYNVSSCNFQKSRGSELRSSSIQIQTHFFLFFKPSQMGLVWKLQNLPYNHTILNSQSERSRQIGILGNLSDFSKQVWTSNKLGPNSKAVLLSGFLIQIIF